MCFSKNLLRPRQRPVRCPHTSAYHAVKLGNGKHFGARVIVDAAADRNTVHGDVRNAVLYTENGNTRQVVGILVAAPAGCVKGVA